MTAITISETHHIQALQLSVDWFDATRHPDFVAWADSRLGTGLATWCSSSDSHGDSEYPDLFVGLEPSLNGEGTDSDMPAAYWDALVAHAKAVFGTRSSLTASLGHIVIRLSPAT